MSHTMERIKITKVLFTTQKLPYELTYALQEGSKGSINLLCYIEPVCYYFLLKNFISFQLFVLDFCQG